MPIAYFDDFSLRIPRAAAFECSAPGRAADTYVADAMRAKSLRRQLDALDPAALRVELERWGAWVDKELADHEKNLARIVWIAACNIREESK